MFLATFASLAALKVTVLASTIGAPLAQSALAAIVPPESATLKAVRETPTLPTKPPLPR